MVFGSYLGFMQAGSSGEVSNPNTSVRKNGGVSGSWDAGFESSDYLLANTTGYVKFTAKTTGFSGSTDQFVMVGFSRSGDTTSPNFSTIRYAAYLRHAGSGIYGVRVFESGTQVYSETSISDGDIISVHRDGGTGAITYKVNGTTVYTSGVTDTNELKIDGTLLRTDNRAEDILLERGAGEFNPFYQNKVNTIEY